jgi:TPR repeat protein
MKVNPLAGVLLVLLTVAVRLPAQLLSTNTVETTPPDWSRIFPGDTNTAAAMLDWFTNSASVATNASATNAVVANLAPNIPVGTNSMPAGSPGTNQTATNEIVVPTALMLATNADATLLTNANVVLITNSPADRIAEIERQFGGTPEVLGWMYEKGNQVPQDFAEAAKWFRKAAEQGNADAQFKLGTMYDNGQGVPRDYAEATKWFRKAAEQGVVAAQYNLGLMYSSGQGVPQDFIEAAKWYGKAAEQGHPEAQFNLAVCCEDGRGVLQDYLEAAKWYGRAAGQGLPAAQNNFGLMHQKGMGLPQNYSEAYKWYNLAAAQGDKDARKNRDDIIRLMTPDQIIQGQKLSREFRVQKESRPANSATAENFTTAGTGFFITDDGYLITNYRVIKDATKIRLLTRAGTVLARMVQVDEADDLAVVKADGPFAALPIAASRTVKLGGKVAAVNFPGLGLQGFAPKLAKGEITSLSGAGDSLRYFGISVPVPPGNAGAALVDERGNVVGIVSPRLNPSGSAALPDNMNYAVKSSFLLGFLESVPDALAKLKQPNLQAVKFEDMVKSALQAAVLVQVQVN